MSGDVHVRFCESGRGRFPPATHPVIHCDTEEQARSLWAALAERLGSLGLELHPEKTKVVYCKDDLRRGEAEHTSFTFLGYDFQGRSVLAKGRLFVGFNPAMSTSAIKAKGKQIRNWHLNRRSGSELSDLAEDMNPQVRGWIGYYGAFYRSKLSLIALRIDQHLVRWDRIGCAARYLSNRPFSAQPSTEPRGHLSVHVALQ